jgi:hypothetical protein
LQNLNSSLQSKAGLTLTDGVECVVCGAILDDTLAIYDRLSEQYFCDESCFEEWFHETFVDEYKRSWLR